MNPEFYDKAYEEGGSNGMYHKHYTESPYYEVWTTIISCIPFGGNIIELGCGVGQLAEYINDMDRTYLMGVDYSSIAIEKAKEKKHHPWTWFIREDILKLNLDTPLFYYDTVIMCEVLEHIEKDMNVLYKIRQGTTLIITVPNYDSESHVRYFESATDALERYKEFVIWSSNFEFDISETKKIFLLIGEKI